MSIPEVAAIASSVTLIVSMIVSLLLLSTIWSGTSGDDRWPADATSARPAALRYLLWILLAATLASWASWPAQILYLIEEVGWYLGGTSSMASMLFSASLPLLIAIGFAIWFARAIDWSMVSDRLQLPMPTWAQKLAALWLGFGIANVVSSAMLSLSLIFGTLSSPQSIEIAVMQRAWFWTRSIPAVSFIVAAAVAYFAIGWAHSSERESRVERALRWMVRIGVSGSLAFGFYWAAGWLASLLIEDRFSSSHGRSSSSGLNPARPPTGLPR